EPESRSACVIVCVEVQPVVAPGASGPEPQGEIVPCLSSVIVNGPARVVLPVFTILYVYVISCPALLYELVDGQATPDVPMLQAANFATESALVCVPVTVCVAWFVVSPAP